MQSTDPLISSPRAGYFWPGLALGGVAFLIGFGLMFGYVQWQSQQKEMAVLTRLVTELQEQAMDDLVTRSAVPALTSVSAVPAALVTPAAVEPAIEPVLEPVLAPVSPPVLAPVLAPVPSTVRVVEPAHAPVSPSQSVPVAPVADLVRTALAGNIPAPSADAQISDALRLETLAIINAGVDELVAAMVAGNYEIHTNYQDESFSGRIHFAFAGDEADQKDLEEFLANAAEAGIVAHSRSVVGNDGRVNGHILLFDLVERALENGTLEEQAAVAKMQAEAVALLTADVTVGEPQNAAGERFYVVEQGDGLAYIALQFYGNTNDFNRIFDANRDQLNTPDRIRVGQRLLIPWA